MNKLFGYKTIIVFFTIFFLFTSVLPLSSTKSTSSIHNQASEFNSGQILFAPIYSKITYLIDNTGSVIHTWESDYYPGESVYWLGDDTILRAIKTSAVPYGGAGGGIQKIQGDGRLLWDYRYDSNGDIGHHDIELLPNGNVLLIAWETKSRTEAIQAGRDPHTIVGDTFIPGHIIEIKPTGPTSGDIIWEWHAWDHLIQDYDSSKENFGVVGDHPELIDINYGFQGLFISDWLHTNSIDYNEQFDQILLSVHNFNEIWVIDHSTTTEEAAGHTGGNSGKGGDLLYRWGNPEAYRAGTSNNEILFGQHDAKWITTGCPGEGHILVFNNGIDRPEGQYSSVLEIVPPINDSGEYYLEPGSSYEPENFLWRYLADPPESFFSTLFSGAIRLKDGNTLICNGMDGEFIEVTPDGTTVWDYINPYPLPAMNSVFKIVYIPPYEPPEPNTPDLDCSGGLSWTNVEPGATVTGIFQVQNIGYNASLLNWTINISSITWGNWSFTPDSGENLTPEAGQITIYASVVAPNEPKSEFEGYLRIENINNMSDFDIIPVTLETAIDVQLIKKIVHPFALNLNYLDQKDIKLLK